LDQTPNSTIAYIALGSNVGDTRGQLDSAIGMLGDVSGIEVCAVSSMIETLPLGRMEQGGYLNAAVKVETSLSALDMFARMVEIENALGRVRTEKWGARTIDLDLLLYGDEIIKTDDLVVPHSQMHLRSFVLGPLVEIAGDVIHPTLKNSISMLADRLGGGDYVINSDAPQLISIAGVIGVGKTTLAAGLAQVLPGVMIKEAYDTNPYIADACAGDSEAALNSQLHFLISRLEQLDKKVLTSGEVFIADYVFEKDRVFAERTLTADQLVFYNERSQRVVKSIASPVLVIYMTDSANAVVQRIHARNRPYEQQIQPGSIEQLSGCYDYLFAGWDKCPVIQISVGEFDMRKQENVELLTNEINHYIFNRTIGTTNEH